MDVKMHDLYISNGVTEYHFNASRSRIEIKCGSVVVAFIETKFFRHYPYFDRIADEQTF